MPSSGKSARGNMEVNGIGMGSNTHHNAHRNVMPAVAAAANSRPEDANEAYRTSASRGPNGINHLLITNPQHKSPDIIRASDPLGVVTQTEPKNIKYLLQNFW